VAIFIAEIIGSKAARNKAKAVLQRKYAAIISAPAARNKAACRKMKRRGEGWHGGRAIASAAQAAAYQAARKPWRQMLGKEMKARQLRKPA